MPSDKALYEYLVCGRAFVLAVSGQSMAYCGIGVCDPYLSQSFASLAPFRYFRAAFTWFIFSATAEGPPPSALGPFELGYIPETVQLFNAGIGQQHINDGLVGVITCSDSNAQNDGVNADRGMVYLVLGMTFSVQDPFQYGRLDTNPPTPTTECRQVSNFLFSEVGFADKLMSAVINYTCISIKFGNQGGEYTLGLGEHYPNWGGPAFGNTIKNGCTGAPGLYLPFVAAFCTGDRDSIKQMRMTATIGMCLVVGPLLSGPLPLNNNNVKTPFLVTLIGYICCVPDANNCGIPTLDPEEVRILKNALRNPPQQMPQGYPQMGAYMPPPPPAKDPMTPAGYPGLPYGNR